MGILDSLKKLLENKPPWTVEPMCLRHIGFTVRLPAGWEFTKNDGRLFHATGPAGASAVFFPSFVNRPRNASPEVLRAEIPKLVRNHVLANQEVTQAVLPNGVLWFEAQGKIVMWNPQPRDPQISPPPGLEVSWTGGDHARDAMRAALRKSDWN